MTTPLWLDVGPQSVIIYKFLYVCPIDSTAFVVSGKVGLTTLIR